MDEPKLNKWERVTGMSCLPLNSDDEALFERVRHMEVSPAERHFFEEMELREREAFTVQGDWLMHEEHNPDQIYLGRYDEAEYEMRGYAIPYEQRERIYANSLDELLHSYMDGVNGRHITVWDWLRERDFALINYEGNQDLKE